VAVHRFFCDANDIALGRGLAQLRRDVVYPGHVELPEVVPGTKDQDWIPVVAERGLVVITRDKRIRRRPVERLAWREGGLRGFVLTGAGNQPTWESARILLSRWDQVERWIQARPEGPWMVALTSGGPLREIDLEVGPRPGSARGGT
jgi:hypothetical protein